jgi:argininosuccinate synthase
LEKIKQKALKFGAIKAIILDAKEEFAKDYITKGIKANASYQGDYHLSTPIGRAITAAKAVKIAEQEGADCIAHGCTGKGNDQVRLEGYALTLNPKIKIIAPVREWKMDRNQEIKYAQKHGIPVPATIDFPYSVDDNMWGMTWEGGEIEEPYLIAPVEKFLTTYTLAKNAPDKEEFIKLAFKEGIPVALNGEKLSLARLVVKLNKLAGKYGVGVVHMFEDRLVGVKNGGIYELPAAHVIIKAHKALEKYVSTRTLNELKETLDTKWAYLCYGALWYDQVMEAINSFNDQVNEKVTGEITIKLFKGSATVVAMKSPFGLDHTSFTNLGGYPFNVNASAGFIEIYSLQMKLANQVKKVK